MDYNLDIISSELKALDDELKHFLDKIEPVLYKDNYQIEDIDFLKTIDFQVIEIQSFNKILWPLLETDDEGILLKKSLINNLLSSLLQTKKRVDAIFENDLKTSQDKLNEYKSRFFELSYCIEFIDNFLDDLQRQRIWLFLLFAMSSNNDLFDFNELTRTASKETDLEKRKKLYLDEYDRVYMLWLKNENNFKSRINDDLVEMGECEQYDEEKDEEFQDLKRHYFDFLDKCQKAIESINFQIKNSSHAGVPVQEPKPPTIIDEIKEMVESSEFLNKNDNFNVNEIIKKFGINIYNEITSIIPHLEQFPESYSLEEKQKHEALLCDQSEIFNKSINAIKKVFTDKHSLFVIDSQLLLYKAIRLILEKNGFSKGLAHYHSFFIFKLVIEDEASELASEINVSDLALIEDKVIEQMKLNNKLLNKILKLITNIEFKSKKSDLYIETIELSKQLSKLNNQISEATNDAEIVQNEIPSITTGTSPDDEIELPEFNIETKEIFESGFVRAFIEEYYEDKIHTYYSDKDRLLYVMCSSDAEKHEVTKKQIEFTKNEINKLGWDDLSFGYLLSCKPDSGPNFIEPNDRFIFWIKRFAEEFQDNTDTFFLVTDTINKLKNNPGFIKKLYAENGEFWDIIDKKRRPKNLNSKLQDLVNLEVNLANQIEYDIDEFEGNNIWNFGIDEYEKHIESNRAIEDLFNISELFVQLNRLQMFQELLQIPAQNEEKKIIHKQTHNNKKEISLSDFLYNKSDFDKLIKIQDEFRTYDGKRMAILIHLLQNEYRILNIISKSKTHSRKHFICLFKEDNSFDKTYAINKYIDSFSNELNLTTALEFDADYVDIKAKLTKIIENQVV